MSAAAQGRVRHGCPRGWERFRHLGTLLLDAPRSARGHPGLRGTAVRGRAPRLRTAGRRPGSRVARRRSSCRCRGRPRRRRLRPRPWSATTRKEAQRWSDTSLDTPGDCLRNPTENKAHSSPRKVARSYAVRRVGLWRAHLLSKSFISPLPLEPVRSIARSPAWSIVRRLAERVNNILTGPQSV